MINPGERKFYSKELKKEIGAYGAQYGKINAAIKYNCSLSTVKRSVRLYYKNNPDIPVVLKEKMPPADLMGITISPPPTFSFNQIIEQKVRKLVKEELTKFFGL